MKRYLLFVGSTYYPSGGWKDYIRDYTSLTRAMDDGQKLITEPSPTCQYPLYDWWHVVDTEIGYVMAQNEDVEDVNQTS